MSKKPEPVDVHVGQRIRERRRAHGMTQTELGDAIGVRFQQVQKYEIGANRVSASKLFMIAEALQVDINYFWAGLESDFAVSGAVDTARANTKEELEMLSAFRGCPKVARASLIAIAAAAGGAA